VPKPDRAIWLTPKRRLEIIGRAKFASKINYRKINYRISKKMRPRSDAATDGDRWGA
jgi:hypothetical protein